MRRLRGLKALVHDAVDFTTELVRDGHESSARSVMRVMGAVPPLAETSRSVDAVRRSTLDAILGTVRGVNRTVEAISDAGLDAVERAMASSGDRGERQTALPLRSDLMGSWSWLGDAGLGLVNGTVGSYLHGYDNGLDLGMEIRFEDDYLPRDPTKLAAALRGARARLVVLIHGLGATEWSWCFQASDNHGAPDASFGNLLERDLGHTPLFLRYNSGRHVSESGRALAERLEEVVGAWPTPVDEIVLIGHSMGGLVARSACYYGEVDGRTWQESVRHVFSLGSPHRGAPLAKLGAWASATLRNIDLPGTRIPGRILAGRSAGMQDLRDGALVDEDWLGSDPDALRGRAVAAIPLLRHARYYFISATVTRDTSHPVGAAVGDLLVRIPSAAGPRIEHHTFPVEARTYGGLLHHQLQTHPAVYEEIREACAATSHFPRLVRP